MAPLCERRKGSSKIVGKGAQLELNRNKKAGNYRPFLYIAVSRPEMCLHIEDFNMTNTPPSCRKRTQRDYNLGFKLAVVEQIEKGEMTYKQAQKAYGIQGRSTVLVWLRKHGKLDWSIPR